MRRHTLDWITHCPERPKRSRIDTERHRLAAAQPAADVCPIVNLRRSQRRGAGCREGALDRPLHCAEHVLPLVEGEAGKRRLAGDTAREATSDEVKTLRAEARQLKEALAEATLENRLLKKSVIADGEDIA